MACSMGNGVRLIAFCLSFQAWLVHGCPFEGKSRPCSPVFDLGCYKSHIIAEPGFQIKSGMTGDKDSLQC